MINNLRKLLAILLVTIAVAAFSGCFLFSTTTSIEPTTSTATSTSESTTLSPITTSAMSSTDTLSSTTHDTNTTTLLTTLSPTTAITSSATTATTSTTTVVTTSVSTTQPTTVTTLDTTAQPTMVTTIDTTTSPLTTITITVSTTTTTITTTITTTAPITTTVSQTKMQTTTQADTAALTVTLPSKLDYTIHDFLDFWDMVVIYTDSSGTEQELGNEEYTISEIDMTTYGVKTISVSYLDLVSEFPIQVHLPQYYQSAEDQTGTELKSTLNTIVNSGLVLKTYGDARYILDDTDRDPLNSSNLIIVYLGESRSGVWISYDTNANWNREHVWPQSLLGESADNNTANVCSDLHNLKPADWGTNSSRGNKYYDNSTTTVSYAPRSEVRGDLARILFYMVIAYEEAGLDLELVNRTPALHEMAMLNVLLSWHELDPVDEFERTRNESIYSFQHNRNPFIDYPDFVSMIWDN